MGADAIVFSMFLVFTGAAVLATVALHARQSLLVTYIALGLLLGPGVTGVVSEGRTIEAIGHVGIIFLLYLLGLNLHPQKLLRLLREATVVTVLSGAAFTTLAAAVALGFGFTAREAAVIGVAMAFSSTIVGLKLLPTTTLHHRHLGEVIISILLLQDLLAIVALLVLDALATRSPTVIDVLGTFLALPLLAALSLLAARHLLVPMLRRFDRIPEYVFLVAVGWSLGIAEIGRLVGLSYEIGAFVAGVALASHPISTYIAESLKPLRDFFLVMFFFSLGAEFPLAAVPEVALPAVVLTTVVLAVKPPVFAALLRRAGEGRGLAREVGVRLGQTSEFALLIAVSASASGAVSTRASALLQVTTIVGFVVSSYLVMARFPTPIAVDDALRRD